MPYRVVLLPGDGIGPEVMREARRVLEFLAFKHDVALQFVEIPCGGRYYLEHGRDWPKGSEEQCEQADVILLGAVGWPSPTGSGPVMMADGKMAGWSAVLGNRTRLDLYANIRPTRLLPGIRSRIHGRFGEVWESSKVDLLIVRENTEGLYAAMGGQLHQNTQHEVATDTRVITRYASERVIRKAFELSRKKGLGAPKDHKRRVTCVAKGNLLHGCQLFTKVFSEIASEYPDIEKESMLVDSFAQSLILEPERFDICVTTNMFGDIVTDLAAVLQGGMGMAVGCNLGERHGMFEPIHGSAPTLASDTANPVAMILASCEALKWLWGKCQDAKLLKMTEAIEAAVGALIQEGRVLTADLIEESKASSTSKVGEEIRRLAESRTV